MSAVLPPAAPQGTAVMPQRQGSARVVETKAHHLSV